MPLDENLKLLLASTISWQACTGQDVYGDESYAAAVELPCHIEESVDAVRTPDTTELVPRHCVYFDANDAHAQTFTLRDRFTAPGIAGGQPTQPVKINPVYGPGGDAWIVEVTL